MTALALDALYKDIILEHNQDPRNFGALPDADKSVEGYNPLCGDRIQLHLKVDRATGTISKCTFEGQGCSICMASTSMLTEEITGASLDHAKTITQTFRGLLQGEVTPEAITEAAREPDLAALSGVRKFPVRIKCAALAWTTLNGALEDLSAPATEEELREWIRPVQDPEMHMSLVDLGLIYKVKFTGQKVDVDMTLTTPTCPAAGAIIEMVRTRLKEHPAVKEADVKLVWSPKWDPRTMASEEAKEKLGLW